VGVDESVIGQVFRENSGRSVAALIRVFGDIDVAEDAVQDAFTVALRRWARDGLPPNPGGWITTTARKRAIDRLRRAARERELLAQPSSDEQPDTAEGPGPMQDDRLRLIFTCCHPALAPLDDPRALGRLASIVTGHADDHQLGSVQDEVR
jgi:RNA polymerase sigma-70 factor (ECF subfamily)